MTRLLKNSFATLGAMAFATAIALPAMAASNDATTPTAPATQEAPAGPAMMQQNMQQMQQMHKMMHKMMQGMGMGQMSGAMGQAQDGTTGSGMMQGTKKHGGAMMSGDQASQGCPGMAAAHGKKSTGEDSGS